MNDKYVVMIYDRRIGGARLITFENALETFGSWGFSIDEPNNIWTFTEGPGQKLETVGISDFRYKIDVESCSDIAGVYDSTNLHHLNKMLDHAKYVEGKLLRSIG